MATRRWVEYDYPQPIRIVQRTVKLSVGKWKEGV